MAKVKTIAPRITRLKTDCAAPPPKTVDPFYLSTEHKEWRERVINNAGGRANERCQGRLPNGMICGKGGLLYADHIEELQDILARGGDPTSDPGQALCPSCHSLKTARERT
jgi:hypothetical protein